MLSDILEAGNLHSCLYKNLKCRMVIEVDVMTWNAYIENNVLSCYL
jgi:hypothetical protein